MFWTRLAWWQEAYKSHICAQLSHVVLRRMPYSSPDWTADVANCCPIPAVSYLT